jgi:hypothetical protein
MNHAATWRSVVRAKLMNVLTDGILWFAVLSTASGAGLLLSAILDH